MNGVPPLHRRVLVLGAVVGLWSCGPGGGFDRGDWQRTPADGRRALAEAWLQSGTWHGASREAIEADLGPAGVVDAWRSWPVPESVARQVWPDLDPRSRIDEPRVTERLWRGHVVWSFESGVRNHAPWEIASSSRPDQPETHELFEILMQLPFGPGILAALDSTEQAVIELEWDAGDAGWFHERALLHVRLVDGRAISAWINLH